MFSLTAIITNDGYYLDRLFWTRSPEDELMVNYYRKNKWQALLYMGSLEGQECSQLGTRIVYNASHYFYLSACQAQAVPEYDPQAWVFLSRWNHSVQFPHSEDWLKGVWNQLAQALRQEMVGNKENIMNILQNLPLQFKKENTLMMELTDSQSQEYPFNMVFSWIHNIKGRHVKEPLSTLLQPENRIMLDKRGILGRLRRLSASNESMAQSLYDGSLLKPAPLSARDAWAVLNSPETFEQVGIEMVKPVWWRQKNRKAFQISAVLSPQSEESLFSASSLISMRPSMVINGQQVSEEELEELAAMEEGVHLLNGQWVEVRQNEIQDLLQRMKNYNKKDLSIFDALRMESGLDEENDPDSGVVIHNDEWLDSWLNRMRSPRINKELEVPESMKGDLFNYQQTGYAWLDMMRQVNLGACLADDMGLGKTLQVLTLLEHLHEEKPEARSLIVVPASLLMNWAKEVEKFCSRLSVIILHGKPAEVLKEDFEKSKTSLAITTYTMARKLDFLKENLWEYLILDEAQAIKNPSTQQTRAVKSIPASHKIALTGTPIENDLSNLWSIFDFLNKGLLGSYNDFKDTSRRISKEQDGYQKLHHLIQPFLLRRMKTDKNIIKDLPDKIEKSEYVSLSKRQTALYLREIKKLEETLKDRDADKITRAGRVLAALTHFKQICNHPDQFSGKQDYKPGDSGKFEVLREICTTIGENRECVLIFTQYREIIPYLDRFLTDVFKAPGLVLHGQTPPKKRQELVDAFNSQKTYIPYMVLSLKAGGTGLNLTQASHVIHFDRWWNPAVENQATDRAYRIGQDKNVVVHKFITSGTIEEHIDELIERKKDLAQQIIGGGADKWITEMSDAELIRLVSLS